VLEALV
jgi:hypothetical protein